MANSEVERTERRWRENRQGFAFANYADALRKTGEAERALEVLREGLALHPTYLPANIVLGRCYLDIGDDGSAHTAFQRVLSLDAENVIALKALAETSERQSDYAEAQRWLEALLVVDRGNESARELLARVQEAAIAVPAGAPALTAGHAADTAHAPTPEHAYEPEPLPIIDASALGLDDAAEAAHTHATASTGSADSIAWVGDADSAVHAAPLALDDLTNSASSDDIHLSGSAMESLGGAPVEELVAEPENDAMPISLDLPSIDHGESYADMVEKTDEIQLHASAGAEYQTPDASDTFAVRDVDVPALDMMIEQSNPDLINVGNITDREDISVTAADVASVSLLEPEHESPSTIDAALPSMLGETVDGATVELASSMHDDAFVSDFEATHVELGPADVEASASAPVTEAAASAPEVHAAPVVPVAITNPVLAAAMPREEILESFRRAAEVRAADIASRPAAAAPVAAEPLVAASAPVAEAEVVEAAVVIDENGPVWETAEYGEDVPLPETIVAEVEPAPAPEPEAFEEPDAAASPDLVITEAMAALYEAQGHHADAREVYRQLAMRHPDESRFAAKVAALDMPAAASEPVAPSSAPAREYAATATGGQSVGVFLGSLLRLAPPALSRNGHHAGAQAGGQPTRPATDPVSLHSMFGDERPASSGAKNGAATTRASQAPSLDEFYGTSASSDAGADQDLEQFHAWLQGLKA